MDNLSNTLNENVTLDPEDWDKMKRLGHQVIDDMINYLQYIDTQRVWKAIPANVKEFLNTDIPQNPQAPETVYEDFKKYIFPYTKGNIHPRYFAWIQGTGTPMGAFADMLASVMNPNVTIGEHSAMYVDKQVVEWCKQLINYPKSSSGILLNGGSMANITALAVARNQHVKNVRNEGLKAVKEQMTLFCSSEAHSCIQKAAEILGLGNNALRKISVNERYQVDTAELKKAIEDDFSKGFVPFCIVGSAGTVNTGAIDPLNELVAISKKYNLWLHIDGAYGALAKSDPDYSGQLKAIEEADSIAFDLHKWLYIPYEVGCALIKNADAHRNAFTVTPDYLLQQQRGLAGGRDPINNYGLELSRGFKALKVWMSLKEHGLLKYARQIRHNNLQAKYLVQLVNESRDLELLAPPSLSIVCYRYKKQGFSQEQLNILNREIIIRLQEEGTASASSTLLNGKYTIRVCIVNHRTKKSDLDTLISETIRIGNSINLK